MQFNYLPQRSSPIAHFAVAQELARVFRDLHFHSPEHLMHTLREHSTKCALQMRVSQIPGTILVQRANYIILRITPQN
jgi:hypothetical protein